MLQEWKVLGRLCSKPLGGRGVLSLLLFLRPDVVLSIVSVCCGASPVDHCIDDQEVFPLKMEPEKETGVMKPVMRFQPVVSSEV